MKRYRINKVLQEQFPTLAVPPEDENGEWVWYDDANAWWNEMKELPRVQDVSRIYELEQEVERLRAVLKRVYAQECEANTQLAAANALLERFAKYWKEDRASSGKSTRLPRLRDEVVTHLAAQPATARVGCEEEDGNPCDVCGKACAWGSRHPTCKQLATDTTKHLPECLWSWDGTPCVCLYTPVPGGRRQSVPSSDGGFKQKLEEEIENRFGKP